MSKILPIVASLVALCALLIALLEHGGCSDDADSVVAPINYLDDDAGSEKNAWNMKHPHVSTKLSIPHTEEYTALFIVLGVCAAVFFLIGLPVIICCYRQKRNNTPIAADLMFQDSDEDDDLTDTDNVSDVIPLMDLPSAASDDSAQQVTTQVTEASIHEPTQSLHPELDQISGGEENIEETLDDDRLELISRANIHVKESDLQGLEQHSASIDTPSTEQHHVSASGTEEKKENSSITTTEAVGDKDTVGAAPSDQAVQSQADAVKEEVEASVATSDVHESGETETDRLKVDKVSN